MTTLSTSATAYSEADVILAENITVTDHGSTIQIGSRTYDKADLCVKNDTITHWRGWTVVL